MKIDYPNTSNENINEFIKNEINKEKESFLKNISKANDNIKYDFVSTYTIDQFKDILNINLNIYSYIGGNHYDSINRSYYYLESENKRVDLNHFLTSPEALERISNLSHYYIMRYSKEKSLNLDEDMVIYGTKAILNNFNHFKFTDQGFSLLFPKGQVSSWNNGDIKITIPYRDLKGIIKDSYLEPVKESTPTRDLNKYKDKKLIAFTFDDGPGISTKKLLDNLDRYDARVTFFVLGSRINSYKENLKQASLMGNTIGSHTYNHRNLPNLKDYELLKEIKDTDYKIKEVTGSFPKFIRPPYGNTNSNIKEAGNMYTVLWNIDTEDWKSHDKYQIRDNILKNAHDGAIVLLHDIYMDSIDGALLAMEELEKQGYAFVTIEEMAILKNFEFKKDQTIFSIN